MNRISGIDPSATAVTRLSANVNAHANFRASETLFLYGGFEWNYEAYFLADREVRRDGEGQRDTAQAEAVRAVGA